MFVGALSRYPPHVHRGWRYESWELDLPFSPLLQPARDGRAVDQGGRKPPTGPGYPVIGSASYSARPARRHPGLVPHESPAAPVQDWWTPHPTWPVLHPAVGRKPIDSASVCADHPAHRAARMASDVIKGAVPKRGETRSKKDLVVVFLWCF